MINTYAPGTPMTGAGWLKRENRARAKIEKHRDPANLLMRRIRQRQSGQDAAVQRAQEEYRAEHAPVPSLIPPGVHPQVADLLKRFLQDNDLFGRDLTLPLAETGEPLEAKIERFKADDEREYQRAVSDLAAIERQNVMAVIEAAQEKLTSLEQRNARDGVVPSAGLEVATETPAADAPRRGRPPKMPKVLLNDSESVTPDE